MSATDLSVADRLAEVLDHLGTERPLRGLHAGDVTGFAEAHPGTFRIADTRLSASS
jgi:hypothetical protein